MSELTDIVKVEIEHLPEYHLYDILFGLGVTKITENWHDLLVIELIFEGDFKDQDIAKALYQHSPAMYLHVGDTVVTVEDYGCTYTYGFTRGV